MTRRPGQLFALVLGLALLAAVFERAAVAVRAWLLEPSRGACWIWAPHLAETADPAAFYAVRDFELAKRVERTAELAVTADETYVLFVNGRRVGSGGYHRGAPPDLYDVAADLQPGWNRLAVELASGRGAGGFLGHLDVDGRTVVATNAKWRVLRRFEAGLLRGWPIDGGEPAIVWHRPPTGRWRLAAPVRRAAFPVEVSPPPRRGAARVRSLEDAGSWYDLDPLQDHFPARFGRWMLFDWGDEVTGYLTLELAAAPGGAGLLHVGRDIPDPGARADALIVPVPGRELWVDAFPRSFRYAFIAGFELRRPPFVQPAEPERAARPEPAGALQRGVFGLVPPPGLSVVEREIRRRLANGTPGDE